MVGRWSHFDDDHGDNQRDDHGNDHDNDDEDDDYDGNDHNQETPPRLLQDHFVWFQGSFVSQINWQPIGKLRLMIQPRPYQGRLMIQFVICTKCVYTYMATSVASCIAVSKNKSWPLSNWSFFPTWEYFLWEPFAFRCIVNLHKIVIQRDRQLSFCLFCGDFCHMRWSIAKFLKYIQDIVGIKNKI